MLLALLIDEQQLLGIREKSFTVFRYLNLFAISIEQLAVELLLKGLNSCCYRRLRQIQRVSCFIKATTMDDIDKCFYILNVDLTHLHSLKSN